MQSEKKKKNKKEPKVKIPLPPADTKADTREEEPLSGFDFGGLPSRDLKKNLGCG
jgi:hypothetical protein